MDGAQHADVGPRALGSLSPEDIQSRRKSATWQWPSNDTILHGFSRDQLTGWYRANHIQVAYAPSAPLADKILVGNVAMLAEMGIAVHLSGEMNLRSEGPRNLRALR